LSISKIYQQLELGRMKLKLINPESSGFSRGRCQKSNLSSTSGILNHITATNLSAGYNSELILKNIAFSIKKGELVTIVGPNGAGKTTLLRVLAKYLEPKSGTVLIEGFDLKKLNQALLSKKLSVVPQVEEPVFNFKVEDFILMGRIPYLKRTGFESEKDFKILQKVLKLVRCEHLVGRRLNQVSGGERRKVLIARALVQDPKILLLDEPTLHLDLNSQIEIMNLLKNLTKKKITVITTLHDLNLAIQYSSRIMLLSNGKILCFGEPEKVLNKSNIKKAFNIDVILRKNPITNKIYIIPVSTFPRRKKEKNIKVHIICGGGTGSDIMCKLLALGFEVSAGVLNVLDSDWETAQLLGIQVVSEAPFSPISNSSHFENLKLMRNADVIVITNVPFGKGNLRNLEALRNLSKRKIIISIEKDPIEKRDFTGGLATKIYKKLNCKIVKNDDDALKILEKIKVSSHFDNKFRGIFNETKVINQQRENKK